MAFETKFKTKTVS